MPGVVGIVVAFVLALGLIATACGGAPTTGGAKKLKIGLVTDTGGVNDKSFNQSAWAGVQKAVNLDDLFARADVVTVHVPLTKNTDKLVNAARLEPRRHDGRDRGRRGL